MELEFLGTGAGVPAKHRNVSSLALKLLAERNAIWLFDCGEGTQMQILRTTIRPRKIEKIFISHLHGDHIFGLPGLLSSRSFQGGEEPIELYGPAGLESYVRTSLQVSKTRLAYPLHFIELSEGVIFKDKQFTVECMRLDHGIDSYGFRVTEANHEGMLQVEKLAELGIPAGPVYGKIKQGQTVTLSDGRVIDGKEFVGSSKKGRIVTIFGDTRFTDRSSQFAKDSDVIIHESTFNKNEAKLAHAYFHSTTQQAAMIAKKAQAKKLMLTHISARYLAKQAKELEEEAQEIFPNTQIAKDFDSIDIPFS
ncbi:ribonuclease Z [Enterococcus dongliensis]|uniref:Ribonuclease Z n=1 Tax=Enterococcus dongliensis TaxID=2559925 RepID=A0AAP5NG35_9ENTE|nr:ribonuclease Z [Enterococcus dongliensis]MDT2595731.1 ribonuclease Z [Enterococcus dongliensis]MDT2602691.1 ribonuclease Z [Enterococcus dongliensis]MDT2612152.1 ribonuclease Z [Enterococcus dongliensis]MDT2633821.1 ribonuclease Z [Enterococcus dongliensis]MDT2636344.1 ribonuclease Z [Enterococcus dongliensis]